MEELAVILIILAIIALVLWVYAIYDIVKGTFEGDIEKVLWLIIVIIFPIVGPIIYLIFGRARRADHRPPSSRY